MSRLKLLASLSALFICGLALQSTLLSQTGQAPRRRGPDELLRLSIAAETSGLAEPFKGITANGRIEPGLFAIRSTGVSTAPVREAADAFLAGLTKSQRDKTTYAVDDVEWRKWMNQSFYVRQGVSFLEMTDKQREAAFALFRASLSAKGLKQTRDIMRLNETLGELNDDNFDEYGEWQYFITVMGKPSATEPWGWQLDGHHAIINYFVLGDQIVMTPFFAGSEPAIARSGRYKGTSVLQDEQGRGLAMVNALDDGQRRKAILKFSKTDNENLTEAWHDNVVLNYAGVRATDLSDAQRKQLLDLVALYVDNMNDGHARVKMDEVRAHLDRTWFAWIGKTDPGSVFYYRIHSPVILIEFDHQRPANLRHLAKDPDVPNLEHVHTVVRTPNGNDYGKDLLRQHYALHPHSTPDDEVSLIAPGGIRAAIERLIPDFERKTGHTVKATFGSGGGTKQQVVRGEAFDVPIVQPPLQNVIASGNVVAATETPLAAVAVAVAVRKGARRPDISTADAVKRMLLAAKAVSYPDAAAGAAAGVSFEETLQRLGIAEQMKPKLQRAQGGAGAMRMLAEGDVDIGLTFLSEITDPGVVVVGPLPRDISTPTALVGFVSAHAKAPEAAKALLSFLSSPEAAAVYKACGMHPGR